MEILALSFNNFGGVLPHSLANLSTKLNRIYLGFNQISGTLPPNIGNLVNFIVFNILDHLFVGVSPTSLGKLTKLQALRLGIQPIIRRDILASSKSHPIIRTFSLG